MISAHTALVDCCDLGSVFGFVRMIERLSWCSSRLLFLNRSSKASCERVETTPACDEGEGTNQSLTSH